MRKSENAPAVTSRPAAKPSKRDAAVTIEKCDRIPDRDTMGRAGAQGRQLRAVLSIAGPALPRGRVGNAAQTQPAVPYLLYWRGVPGVRPRLAGVRVPPAIGRGASLVSASQQTVAENAKTRAHLKPAFTIISDRGGRIAQLLACAGAFLSHEMWGLSLTTAWQRAICKVRR